MTANGSVCVRWMMDAMNEVQRTMMMGCDDDDDDLRRWRVRVRADDEMKGTIAVRGCAMTMCQAMCDVAMHCATMSRDDDDER